MPAALSSDSPTSEPSRQTETAPTGGYRVPLPESSDQDMRLRLAELICTRFCHDITGPIGAVNNGVEFLREEGESLLDQAVSLIDDSAQQAIQRIQFFRQAYGRVNFAGEADLEELRAITLEYFRKSKVTCDWPALYTDSQTYSFSRKMGKLMLNMILLASETLMRGGNLSIKMEKNEGSRVFTVRAEGTAVKCDETALALLQGKKSQSDLDPRSAQLFMTLLLASELGADITYNISDTKFRISAMRQD